ncbi:MAG: glycosyltransferase [Pseudohaliea sp.]
MSARILHVTFDMGIGGTEQVIRNLVLAADASRYAMSVFCLEAPVGAFGERLQAAGIDVTAHGRRPGLDGGLVRALRRHLREQRIDLLHCHQYTPWAYGVLAALGTGVPVVFTEHGRFHPDRRSRKRRFVNPLLARRTARVTAISQATARALVDYEYLPAGRVEVVYNGIGELDVPAETARAARERYHIPPQAPLLGTIARFDPIKNHPMLLRAFAQVLGTQPDARLLMVGDGPERPRTEALAAELGIADRVVFTGFEPEPAALLAAMDLFLLPSLSEGTSMTLLEAMALGKPCVVTDVGGNPEIVIDGETGRVTPSDDAGAFADALTGLLADPARREAMAGAAKARFATEFTSARMAERYAAIYDDILGEGK